MTDIDAIVAGLSGAQRRVLVGEARSIGNPESLVLTDDWLIYSRRSLATRAVLKERRIIEEGKFGPTMLTSLGKLVHARLMEQANAG